MTRSRGWGSMVGWVPLKTEDASSPPPMLGHGPVGGYRPERVLTGKHTGWPVGLGLPGSLHVRV